MKFLEVPINFFRKKLLKNTILINCINSLIAGFSLLTIIGGIVRSFLFIFVFASDQLNRN